MADPKTIEKFSHPEVIDMLVDALNNRNSGQITEQQTELLKKNAPLAERVFNGGLSELIVVGRTNIDELSKQSPEVWDALSRSRLNGAVKDGTLNVAQLGNLDKNSLQQVSQLLAGNIDRKDEKGSANFSKACALLGLDEKQADALHASTEATDESHRKLPPHLFGKPSHGLKGSPPNPHSHKYLDQGARGA